MKFKEYFAQEPYGAKTQMAETLGITTTWLSLLINGSRRPSVSLSKKIEKFTKGRITAKELRPDVFDN